MKLKQLCVAAAAVGAIGLTACGPPPATPAPGRYVSNVGADTGNCATPGTACATITYAVSQAAAGETVFVGAGTYPEMVIVDKALTFKGANAGIAPEETRAAESVVKGFRTPGEPHPNATGEFNVTIDGFSIDPQGDAALISAPTHHLVGLFGSTDVKVINNLFDGGDWTPDCGYTCTTMTDAAVMVMSGTYEIRDNTFTDFRAPIDVTQFDASKPVVSAHIVDNKITHVTNRAIWINEYQGGPFTDGAVTVTGNTLDATGWTSPDWSPAGIVLTAGGATIDHNWFTYFGSGVFSQVCDGTNAAGVSNTFTDNVFDNNRSGIQFFVNGACGTTTVGATITDNNFSGGNWTGGGLVDVPQIGVRWNEVGGPRPNDINAECNWWATADGPNAHPASSTITAGVDADPWNVTPDGGCTGTSAGI